MSFSTLNTAKIFEKGVTDDAADVYIIKLSASKFVAIYDLDGENDEGEFNQVCARVGVVSGNNINFYAETVLYSNLSGGTYNAVDMYAVGMDSEHVAIFVTVGESTVFPSDRKSHAYFIPCYLAAGGTTLLPGFAQTIEEDIPAVTTSGVQVLGAVRLTDTTGAVISHIHDGGVEYDRKQIILQGFTQSGNVGSLSTMAFINSGGTSGAADPFLIPRITALNSTRVVVGWHRRLSGDPSHNKYFAAVCDSLGSVFSIGPTQEIGAVNAAVPPVALGRQDSTHFVMIRSSQMTSFLVSGTTITGGSPVGFSYSGGTTINLFAINSESIFPISDTQMLVFYTATGFIRAANFTFSGTTITRDTSNPFGHDYPVYNLEDFDEFPSSVFSESPTDVILIGGNKLLFGIHADKDFFDDPEYGFGFWDFGGVLLSLTTLFDLVYDSVYLLGASAVSDTVYVTAWANGSLILNIISIGLGEQIDSIILGSASFSQVQNKTLVAYPCALSDSTVYVFGRIDTGATIAQVLLSTDGGSNFNIVESSWGTDYAGAMVCRGLGDFFVMRCSAISSKLYQYADGSMSLLSTVPFAGPVRPHGLRLSPWDESLLAAVNVGGIPQTVMYSFPPYFSWADITANHPQTAVNSVVPL